MMDKKKLPVIIINFFIIVLCFLCYFHSLDGSFTFDDQVAIVKNSDVTNWQTSYTKIFGNDFWGHNLTDPETHKSYRPLTVLFFHWQYRLFGLNAFFMKAVNFFLHCLVCILLGHVLPILFPSIEKQWLLLATILFAVHPIHCEVICGVVGQSELICSIFWIVGVWVMARGLQRDYPISITKDALRIGLLSVLTLLAMLSKETGITVLVTCLMMHVLVTTNLSKFVQRRDWSVEFYQSPKRVAFNWIVMVTLIGILIILRLWIIDFKPPIFKVMDNPVGAAESLLVRICSQSFLYALNLWLLLCPVWLSFDWALGSIRLIETVTDVRILPAFLIYSLLALLILNGSRNIHTALVLMIIPFLPASGIVKLGFVIAERVLYIPSIGFCVLVVMGYQRICEHWHQMRYVFHAIFAAAVIVMVLKTRQRSYEWMTEERLFTSGLKVCPNNAKIYYNIAKLSADKGNTELAFKYYHKAIELFPDYESALMNLGNLYRDKNDYDLAEKYIKRSIEALDEFPAAWMNLGIVLASQHKYNESLNAYETALKYRKRYATCHYNMGNLYIEMKNSDMALKSWQQSLTIDPKQAKAWANLLALIDNNGMHRDVIRLSEVALQHAPNDPTILFTRANAYGKLNEFEEAELIYKEVIQLRPNYALYYVNLGVLYHRWGKKQHAIRAYETALQIDPHSRSVKENLKNLLKSTGQIN
ncbi:protein O-mannosyl-transferase TMTC4 [Bradysia coprophila]|uniref:protein O-mannosyl-transferase TMTC4 n=1 Tax=Bradysia coprophila TaxID=38358 RepID=UPI00187DB235|nr:protein O-mannosyl-transferase TMTC4 [Bradysia coprophila]